jgi:hypothetical protein
LPVTIAFCEYTVRLAGWLGGGGGGQAVLGLDKMPTPSSLARKYRNIVENRVRRLRGEFRKAIKTVLPVSFATLAGIFLENQKATEFEQAASFVSIYF